MFKYMFFLILNVAQNPNSVDKGDVRVFAEHDPYGIIMAIIGMGIVFIVLVLLFIIFTNTPLFFKLGFRNKLKNLFALRKKKEEVKNEQETISEEQQEEELSGEVNAAIAAAIYLYRTELHDYEDTVLTIRKVSRTYSPWNSKIYNLRNNLNANI